MIALIATLLVDQMLILSDPAYPLQSVSNPSVPCKIYTTAERAVGAEGQSAPHIPPF